MYLSDFNINSYVEKYIINSLNVAPDEIGLKKGSTALAVTCFLLSRYYKEKSYVRIGKSFLDFLSERVAELTDWGFEMGISGIGFAIEWININKCVQLHTDSILEDIDDNLYKYIIYGKSANKYPSDDLIGICHYFDIRIKSNGLHSNPYKKVGLKACLQILADLICSKTKVNCFPQFKTIFFIDPYDEKLIELSMHIFIVIKLWMHSQGNIKLINHLHQIISFVEDNFQDLDYYALSNARKLNLEYLCLFIFLAGKKIGIEKWCILSNYLSAKIDPSFDSRESKSIVLGTRVLALTCLIKGVVDINNIKTLKSAVLSQSQVPKFNSGDFCKIVYSLIAINLYDDVCDTDELITLLIL